MDYFEERVGTTPNGGVKSIIYYFDDNGNATDKQSAKRCRIVEVDAHGKAINEISGVCG